MKNLRRIFVWALLSIFIQSAGLFYLDKFYFVTETTFKTKKVEQVAKTKPSNIKIQVPDQADNVSVSYDGKYTAYYIGDTLKVVNTETGQIKDVQFDDGVKVSYYKWLPDVDSMIIAEKQSSNKGYYLSFSNYDVQKNRKKDIKDDINGNSGRIYLNDKTSEVQDIELSTLTNIIYVKVGHKGGRNSIYRINVMAEMEKERINSYLTGNIVIFPHEDKFAYEDLTYHKVYVTGVQGSIKIKGVTNPCVFAVDGDDNLYIGQVQNEKVTKIYYGSIKDDTSTWKSVSLQKPADKKDIYITEDGKIYVNDNLRGIVTELGSGKETVYNGEFLQMYNNGVASVREGMLLKTMFK